MKVFIVFIGLMLVYVTFICYQGDLNRYVQLQTLLKAAAEECAAGSALYYDEDAYAQGLMIINKTDAENYTAYITDRAAGILELDDGENLSYTMEVFDDSCGAADTGQPPCVTVTLKLAVSDLFRLPFLKAEQVVRSTKYELADY